jgi:hypothetical protein
MDMKNKLAYVFFNKNFIIWLNSTQQIKKRIQFEFNQFNSIESKFNWNFNENTNHVECKGKKNRA